MEYYEAERKKELLPFATTWMELESIMLSEVSWAMKDKYHVISRINGTYHSFWTVTCTFPHQIWEEKLGASYSLNVAYLAHGGGGRVVVERGFSPPYFPSLKPRYVLWFGVSYSPKNMVINKTNWQAKYS